MPLGVVPPTAMPGRTQLLQLVSRRKSKRKAPGDPTFGKFASKHFNLQYDGKKKLDSASMVSFTPAKTIARSLTKLDDIALEKIAVGLWKSVQNFINSGHNNKVPYRPY